MSLFARLLLVAAALPFVLAHDTGSSTQCQSTEFYWSNGECCLPNGGSKNPPSPPKGSNCPSKWEWSQSKNHCVPQTPPSTGTPSCSTGWGWNAGKNCCEQHATTTTPTKPTSTPGNCNKTEFYWGDGACCLPNGGYGNPPSPPKGSQCPSGWQWNTSKNHCIPQQPPSSGTPSCSSGWGWSSGSKCCEPKPPTTTHITTTHVPQTTTSAPPPSASCKPSEWYYGDKDMCIPHGGYPNPPQPPSGTSCPNNWNWYSGKKCCLPNHPDQPPPQCGSGWGWDNGSKCCFPHQSTPPVPTPSSKPKGGHGYYKRAHGKTRTVSLCPNGLAACPIAGLTGLTDDWQCVDTRNDLESCGGCASTGAGQDCTAIKGAWNVGCNDGQCVVLTCAAGYLRSSDNKACIKV